MQFQEQAVKNVDKIFKGTSYDIRAYVGEPGAFFSGNAVLTPDAMFMAGRLMGGMTFHLEDGSTLALKDGDAVVIGYDNGPTSEYLAEAFAEGLVESGIIVYDIGTASSGQVYQNQEQLKAQGHVQITRSHVEVTTNGAKFGIGTQGIHTYLLKQMNEAVKNNTPLRQPKELGYVEDMLKEGRDAYYEKMMTRYGSYFAKRDNAVVAVNLFGGTGLQYATLFQEVLGSGSSLLGVTVDVNSGALLADPTRKEMVAKVPKFQQMLDAGKRIHSFDLDADRGSVTEGGDALTLNGTGHYLGDGLSYLLAEHKMKIAVPRLLAALAGRGLAPETLAKIEAIAKKVYIDARYTSGVKSRVEALGGTTEFHCKGHSLWKETIMKNMKMMASLAGFASVAAFARETGYRDYQIEASLHMFATDNEDGIPRDDAVENIFILEQVLDELNISSLADFFAKIPARYITKEIRTPSDSNDIKELVTADCVDEIRQFFAGKKSCEVTEFEGQIRVDWAEGFLMYGMSNTSPKLTFMTEGVTVEQRNMTLAYVLALHNKYRAHHGDTAAMDTDENPFFVQDATYAMGEPDEVTAADPRVDAFIAYINAIA